MGRRGFVIVAYPRLHEISKLPDFSYWAGSSHVIEKIQRWFFFVSQRFVFSMVNVIDGNGYVSRVSSFIRRIPPERRYNTWLYSDSYRGLNNPIFLKLGFHFDWSGWILLPKGSLPVTQTWILRHTVGGSGNRIHGSAVSSWLKLPDCILSMSISLFLSACLNLPVQFPSFGPGRGWATGWWYTATLPREWHPGICAPRVN